MTVAELIAHLQTMPQDRQIVCIPDTRPDDGTADVEPMQLIWLEPKNNLKAAIRFAHWSWPLLGEPVITYL